MYGEQTSPSRTMSFALLLERVSNRCVFLSLSVPLPLRPILVR